MENLDCERHAKLLRLYKKQQMAYLKLQARYIDERKVWQNSV